jgi:hypothetical protein
MENARNEFFFPMELDCFNFAHVLAKIVQDVVFNKGNFIDCHLTNKVSEIVFPMWMADLIFDF